MERTGSGAVTALLLAWREGDESAPDVAVHGEAATDADFAGGSDRISYVVDVAGAPGPFRVQVELWYQTIGYRWADNLREYDAPETRRFLAYFDAMGDVSAAMLARAEVTVPGPD